MRSCWPRIRGNRKALKGLRPHKNSSCTALHGHYECRGKQCFNAGAFDTCAALKRFSAHIGLVKNMLLHTQPDIDVQDFGPDSSCGSKTRNRHVLVSPKFVDRFVGYRYMTLPTGRNLLKHVHEVSTRRKLENVNGWRRYFV